MKTALLLTISISIIAVNASECTLWFWCGRVENRTPYNALWVDLGKKGNNCKLWNVGGGDVMDEDTVTCQQNPLDPNSSKGGRTHDGIDVDAFTFPNHDYYIKFGNEPGQHFIPAGEFVKVSSDQTAICNSAGQLIYCVL